MKKQCEVFGMLASGWDDKNKTIKAIYDGESERLVKLIPDILHHGDVVGDFGCGTGKVTERILNSQVQNLSIYLVDGSQYMINKCREKFHQFDNVNYLKSEIEEVPYKNKFDVIFLQQVLHHLDNPEVVIAHLIECLKPDGKIVALTLGKNHMQDVIKYDDDADLLGRFSLEQISGMFCKYGDYKIIQDQFKMEFPNQQSQDLFLEKVGIYSKLKNYSLENPFIPKPTVELPWRKPEDSNQTNNPVVSNCEYLTIVFTKGKHNDENSTIAAYSKWSSIYDEVVIPKLMNRGYGYHALAETIAHYIPSTAKKVLEIGAGTGLVGDLLKAKRPELSLSAIELTASMADRINPNTYKELVISDVSEVVDLLSNYDAVYSTFAFHHLKNMKMTVKQIYDKLRIGGTIIIVDLMETEKKMTHSEKKIHSEVHEYGAFCNYYCAKELVDNLSKTGFSNITQINLGKKVGLAHYLITGTK